MIKKEFLLKLTRRMKDQTGSAGKYLLIFLKWAVLACVVGTAAGLVGAAFYFALGFVTQVRTDFPVLVLFLPLAGLLIVFLYRAAGIEKSRGTNLVLLAVRSEEKVPFRMAPLIFTGTLLTHLFGGSAGREGAALQLGGSIAAQLGRWFHLDAKDMHIITMCGMSACFSALFGTPIAAAVFSMEVVSVGVMYYAALVPCAIASVLAAQLAGWLGAARTQFTISEIPAVGVIPILQVLLLAALCAAVSILFCAALKGASQAYRRLLPNQYARAAAGGGIVVLLAFLLQTGDYLGAGVPVIQQAMAGQAEPEAFALKIVFTAVTIGAGFKGGEIVPSFFVGATFGCFFGGLIGLSPSFSAALGLVALFCGVTNCPLSSLLMSFELFASSSADAAAAGAAAGSGVFFLLAVAVSYMLSGYFGLYSKQKIIYSKYSPRFINTESI